MFCGIATTVAKSGKMEALVTAARDHGRALRTQPGCLATYVLVERGSSTQVSISVFDTEDSFQRAVEATRGIIAKHHIDELWQAPSSFRMYDVR
jgi:heme-degrading monooxygenase HmoA